MRVYIHIYVPVWSGSSRGNSYSSVFGAPDLQSPFKPQKTLMRGKNKRKRK